MDNWDIAATWAYHNGTKHTYESVRRNAQYLDWTNQPLSFKIYTDIEAIPLSQELTYSSGPGLASLSATAREVSGECVPEFNSLSSLLYHSAGITRRRDYGGGEIYFRAAACTGALYHIDLYLVAGDLPGLPAGVYHYGPHDNALRRLRQGDYRSVLVQATAQQAHASLAPAFIVFTCTFWRNAWKYQDRTYRHTYWDCGTILANFQTVAAAAQIPATVLTSFVDDPVNRLLDLDTNKEVSVAIVPLGRLPVPDSPECPDMAPLGLETRPLSRNEVNFPMVRAIHAASSLTTEEEVSRVRGPISTTRLSQPAGKVFPLQHGSDEELPPDPVEKIIQRRGSTRKFALEAISYVQLSNILSASTAGMQADFLGPTWPHLSDLYLTVHAVNDLPGGSYVYHRDTQALELLKEGDFRRESGYLGLSQEIPADASVNIFFLTDLEPVLDRMGNRGYRAAQLEASITAGKVYLACYAQRVGASGLTFFDDDVTDFFSPHAAGKSVMFLVAIGKRARRIPATPA